MRLADDKGFKSIAFPAISTGLYGVPPELAADAMLDATINYLKEARNIKTVIFCLYENRVYKAYERKLKELIYSGLLRE